MEQGRNKRAIEAAESELELVRGKMRDTEALVSLIQRSWSQVMMCSERGWAIWCQI